VALSAAACSPGPQTTSADATSASTQAAASGADASMAGQGGADLSGVWTNDPPAETRSYQNWAFSAELPPMTPWAMARYEAAKPTFGDRAVPVAETNDPVYQCFPPGTPRIYFHPFPMEIVQQPGRVLMIFEYDHLIRQIYTDGRDHRDDLAPSWMGDSIGHWEGDTLVVETTNFNDKTWLDRRGVPHSDQMKLMERIHLNDDGDLQIDLTIDDPVAFTAPVTGHRYYRKVDWNIEEFMCMDNVSFEEFEDSVLSYGDGDSSEATGDSTQTTD
jgi:hypothetical protein